MKQKKTNISIVSDLILTDLQASDFENKIVELAPEFCKQKKYIITQEVVFIEIIGKFTQTQDKSLVEIKTLCTNIEIKRKN